LTYESQNKFKESIMNLLKNSSPAGLWKKLMLSLSILAFSLSSANAVANCTNAANPDIVIAVASNMWKSAQALVTAFNDSNGTNYA
jgi:hypothetical protein